MNAIQSLNADLKNPHINEIHKHALKLKMDSNSSLRKTVCLMCHKEWAGSSLCPRCHYGWNEFIGNRCFFHRNRNVCLKSEYLNFLCEQL